MSTVLDWDQWSKIMRYNTRIDAERAVTSGLSITGIVFVLRSDIPHSEAFILMDDDGRALGKNGSMVQFLRETEEITS